jgi:hypothetical protein
MCHSFQTNMPHMYHACEMWRSGIISFWTNSEWTTEHGICDERQVWTRFWCHNSLLNDANDVTVPERRKHALRKKKYKILNVFYISYYVLYISYNVLAILYYVLYISHYVLDEYPLMLVLNMMSKKLKSVMKKLFKGNSRVRTMNTLFQGCSSATSWRVEILRHIDPTLVGRTVCFKRDEMILIFSYHFTIWIYWLLFIPFCRTRWARGWRM